MYSKANKILYYTRLTVVTTTYLPTKNIMFVLKHYGGLNVTTLEISTKHCEHYQIQIQPTINHARNQNQPIVLKINFNYEQHVILKYIQFPIIIHLKFTKALVIIQPFHNTVSIN